MKYVRCVIILTVALLIASTSFAQTSYQDVVYLRNGSVIRGMIIEQIPGKTIKIETADRNVFVFTYDEIEKISKEESPARADNQNIEDRVTGEARGSTSNARALILRSGIFSVEEESVFGFSIVGSRFINDYFSSGIGAGFESYPNGHMIPLFLDMRAYFVPGQVSPFVFADVGYALASIEGYDGYGYGGFLLNAGGGLDLRTTTNIGFMFEVGYKLQKAKCAYTQYYWDPDFGYIEIGTSKIDTEYNGITIKAALTISFSPLR